MSAPTPVAGPTAVRRQLGRQLRALRDAAGTSVDEVVAHRRLGISRAKLFKMEAGRHPVKPQDVAVLCAHYQASAEETEQLTALALATAGQSWWHVYGDDVPEWFSLYLEIEPAAAAIRTYEAELIPGLLQTPEYAREVYRARNPDDGEIERRVALRMERQAILTRDNQPPTLHVVLNEAAVRREVGGPDVMVEQITRLRQAASRPTITISVLPLKAGAHAAMESAFVILDFPDPTDDPSVVYIDSPSSAAYLQKAAEIARYEAIFGHVLSQAVPILEYQP
ncbi:helix-turn-helix transcriptional regulator [Micromonospora sp. WMMA1363]|uniref:helix-turn-helix domain-containing protein n=1 Tax=Micromonospora sp. WMMA1363 TaxID=3053985 RepID=UPI00259C9450|nr:helix-turn-helix transcriptional regulator [Micromonospora sp. WMMA1363]MDM4723488.1 helix-turn-helix transcriptional regulator [Micromonospora sp. WMMA1363]